MHRLIVGHHTQQQHKELVNGMWLASLLASPPPFLLHTVTNECDAVLLLNCADVFLAGAFGSRCQVVGGEGKRRRAPSDPLMLTFSYPDVFSSPPMPFVSSTALHDKLRSKSIARFTFLQTEKTRNQDTFYPSLHIHAVCASSPHPKAMRFNHHLHSKINNNNWSARFVGLFFCCFCF